MKKIQQLLSKNWVYAVVMVVLVGTLVALMSSDVGLHSADRTPEPFVTIAPTATPTARPMQAQTIVPLNTPTYIPAVTRAPQLTPVVIITPRPTVPIVTSTPVPTSTPTPPSLQYGFKNSYAVRAMQKRLKELGWYTGNVDGDFGPSTLVAVKAFQQANGLKVDGKAGEQTLARLNSTKAVANKSGTNTKSGKSGTTVRPTAKPRPTATPNLSRDYYLESGSSGSKVRTLQNRLIALGYLSGKATGEYDAATRAAVFAFQDANKLWKDGIAGPKTLKLLYSNNAKKASSAVASMGETLESGSKGSAVKALQKRLKELGYLKGSVDGSYGEVTEDAVKRFQKQHGLKVDGKAGAETLELLYSAKAEKCKEDADDKDTKKTKDADNTKQ